MEIHSTPKGVCSNGVDIERDEDTGKSLKYTAGSIGNTQGVAALAKGMTVEEYIKRCKDIKCGFKKTSCPAQLALALEEALETAK